MARGREPDGGRGDGWVAAQFALFGAIVVAPHLGPRWPRWLARVARLLGAPLLPLGGWLLARGMADLGTAFTPFPKPLEDAPFVREGLYARMRHPIYTGAIALGLGWSLLTANTTRLLLATGLVALFDAKARREEVWLGRKFPEYARYRAEVSKLLPRIY